MLVIVETADDARQQLLVTRRTSIETVQALMGLPIQPLEWQCHDGTWALADLDARLVDLADDLRGDGSSDEQAFRVRLAPGTAGKPSPCQPSPAKSPSDTHDSVRSYSAADAQVAKSEPAVAPESPKQHAEAVRAAALAPRSHPAAAGAPLRNTSITSVRGASEPATPVQQRAACLENDHVAAVTLPNAGDAAAAVAAAAAASPQASSMRSDSAGSLVAASVASAKEKESADLRRLATTLPLLVGGSHIAVVDARRDARDAMAQALQARLPESNVYFNGRMQPFRALRLVFDRTAPFQAGLDGFWRWVIDALRDTAPDLFPATGLPGDASGFEEAFSEDRVRGAPPVVLICSEACALAEASSWFVSRFLGTLRDMGNEQHRFFLHAVAMIGGEPLRNVDMEAYMCKMSTSLTSTLESSASLKAASRTSVARSSMSSRRSSAKCTSRKEGRASSRSTMREYAGRHSSSRSRRAASREPPSAHRRSGRSGSSTPPAGSTPKSDGRRSSAGSLRADSCDKASAAGGRSGSSTPLTASTPKSESRGGSGGSLRADSCDKSDVRGSFSRTPEQVDFRGGRGELSGGPAPNGGGDFIGTHESDAQHDGYGSSGTTAKRKDRNRRGSSSGNLNADSIDESDEAPLLVHNSSGGSNGCRKEEKQHEASHPEISPADDGHGTAASPLAATGGGVANPQGGSPIPRSPIHSPSWAHEPLLGCGEVGSSAAAVGGSASSAQVGGGGSSGSGGGSSRVKAAIAALGSKRSLKSDTL